MNDVETVKQVIQLCELGLYDEAMAMTYKIDNISASISAYLLVMECKERRDSSKALKKNEDGAAKQVPYLA